MAALFAIASSRRAHGTLTYRPTQSPWWWSRACSVFNRFC